MTTRERGDPTIVRAMRTRERGDQTIVWAITTREQAIHEGDKVDPRVTRCTTRGGDFGHKGDG
jgi:hypothetical protein